MNRGSVISLIARRLASRTDLNADILLEMDLAQSTALERNGRVHPWFLETEVATATTVVGEERLTVPTDFAMEKETGGLFLYQATGTDHPWTKLVKDDYEAIVLKHQDGQGTPENYSLGGKYFRLRPIPDSIFTIKQIYFATDTPPSTLSDDNQTNLWMTYAPDLLIAVVAKTMASKYLQDQELAASFDPDLANAWGRVNIETETQEHTNRDYKMGYVK